MRMFGITFPLVVASIGYPNEQTSRSPLLRGLGLRSIVAPKDQLEGKRKLATIKEGFFEDVIGSSERQLTKWTLCGESYCMAQQNCTAAKECICKEGYESDGGQGCQDFDECASDDYPCSGREGIDSFCENRDPDNSYYKCGCYPGYAAILPEVYNETETGIPINFRPESCEETPLVQNIVQTLIISVDNETNVEELVKSYEQVLLSSVKSSINSQSYFPFSTNAEVSVVDIRIHTAFEVFDENSVSENGSSGRRMAQKKKKDNEEKKNNQKEKNDNAKKKKKMKAKKNYRLKGTLQLTYSISFDEDGKVTAFTPTSIPVEFGISRENELANKIKKLLEAFKNRSSVTVKDAEEETMKILQSMYKKKKNENFELDIVVNKTASTVATPVAATITIDICHAKCDTSEEVVDLLKTELTYLYGIEDVSAKRRLGCEKCKNVNQRKRSLQVKSDMVSSKYDITLLDPSGKLAPNTEEIKDFLKENDIYAQEVTSILQFVNNESASTVALSPSPPPSDLGIRKLAERMNEYYMSSRVSEHSFDHITQDVEDTPTHSDLEHLNHNSDSRIKLNADTSDDYADMPDFLNDPQWEFLFEDKLQFTLSEQPVVE